MATTITHTDARRTAQALWTLIEPQPQEVKDYLVRIITSSPYPAKKSPANDRSARLKALKGCLKNISVNDFADDERAQYILGK